MKTYTCPLCNGSGFDRHGRPCRMCHHGTLTRREWRAYQRQQEERWMALMGIEKRRATCSR